MDAAAVRSIALGLPEVEVYDHGGLPAFRVRGTRFATMLDPESSTVNLMLGEAGTAANGGVLLARPGYGGERRTSAP